MRPLALIALACAPFRWLRQNFEHPDLSRHPADAFGYWLGMACLAPWLLAWVGVWVMLTGCQPQPAYRGNPTMPAPGSVTAVRESVAADGAQVRETVTIVAPQASTEGTPVSLPWGGAPVWLDGKPSPVSSEATQPVPRIEVGFSGSQDLAKIGEAMQPEDNQTEKWIFYGGAGVFLLLALALGYYGRHFKLMALAFIGSICLTGLGVAVTRYPLQLLLFIGVGVVSLIFLVGWFLWRDYKEDGVIGNKPLPGKN